jgi:hypothetical protein
MNLDAIIQSLKDERSRIDAALAALKALGGEVGNPKATGAAKRHVSLASRRKMAAAQRARWAKRKARK